MLAELAGSTLTPTIGTEHILAETGGDPDLPAGRNYLLRVGLRAMQNGDAVELRVYGKTLSTSTAAEEYSVCYAHRQGVPNVVSVPIAALHHIRCTLRQTAGTARDFPWSAVSLDG